MDQISNTLIFGGCFECHEGLGLDQTHQTSMCADCFEDCAVPGLDLIHHTSISDDYFEGRAGPGLDRIHQTSLVVVVVVVVVVDPSLLPSRDKNQLISFTPCAMAQRRNGPAPQCSSAPQWPSAAIKIRTDASNANEFENHRRDKTLPVHCR